VFFAPSAGRGAAPAANGPFKDGWVLPQTDPSEQVPLMLGFVADDIGIAGGGLGQAPAKPTVATFETGAQRTYGAQASTFLMLYPVTEDADVPAAQKAAGRDRARVSVDLWAGEQQKPSGRIYTYYFDRVLPWPAHPEFGAFHTSEVPYLFQTLDRLDRPWEPIDRRVSDTVSSYWTNFANMGDPNGKGLPAWPAYRTDGHVTMELGERMGTMPVAERARLDFYLANIK
jgi:para-nitrobenzyl esterase